MKKYVMLVAAIATMFLSSCKKDRLCGCKEPRVNFSANFSLPGGISVSINNGTGTLNSSNGNYSINSNVAWVIIRSNPGYTNSVMQNIACTVLADKPTVYQNSNGSGWECPTGAGTGNTVVGTTTAYADENAVMSGLNNGFFSGYKFMVGQISLDPNLLIDGRPKLIATFTPNSVF